MKKFWYAVVTAYQAFRTTLDMLYRQVPVDSEIICIRSRIEVDVKKAPEIIPDAGMSKDMVIEAFKHYDPEHKIHH